jgi:hypothetical protein
MNGPPWGVARRVFPNPAEALVGGHKRLDAGTTAGGEIQVWFRRLHDHGSHPRLFFYLENRFPASIIAAACRLLTLRAISL